MTFGELWKRLYRFFIPKNPIGECICKSRFDVELENITINGSLIGGSAVGTIKLKGSLCPCCKNQKSHFTLSFEDNDPLIGGDKSFKFIPLSINSPMCYIYLDQNQLIQFTDAVGQFIPAEGEVQALRVSLNLVESLAPSHDDQFSIAFERNFSLDLIITENVLDDSLVITECYDEE